MKQIHRNYGPYYRCPQQFLPIPDCNHQGYVFVGEDETYWQSGLCGKYINLISVNIIPDVVFS